MTVIAWDGRMLAADKRACGNGQLFTTRKVFRVVEKGGDTLLVGVCGDGDKVGEFVAWCEAGRDPSAYPKNTSDGSFTAIVIESTGRILQYERTPYPLPVEESMHTIGSGRDYALAAMHLGKNAREAVALASKLDEGCGNGIDALAFGVDVPQETHFVRTLEWTPAEARA